MTNLTDETPTAIEFRVHSFGPEWDERVTVEWAERGASGECDGDSASWYCGATTVVFPELLPAPGGTVDIPIDVHNRERQEPFEGKFMIEVSMTWGEHEKRVTASEWFTLKLVDDPEADLLVLAPDVKQAVRVGAGGRLEPTGTLHPGATGAVRYRVVNQGRKAVSGVNVTLRLPAGVTFTQPPQECAIDDDGRSAVCAYDALALVPAGQDTDPNDSIHSAVELHNLVTVSAATRAPVTLAGGTVQVEGLTERIDTQSGPMRTELPANAVAVPAADVDASDNQDGFAVVVAKRKSDSGGDDGDDGSSGGGGSLPITGPQIGLIAGAGLAMVAGGGIMLLLARRRNRLPHA
ncbi:hypothetical protein [Micromonospora sp. NPDC051296]|uniref:hypothetical protein n=1 Tax=Micromonospora sp. NPDC051296 TaxID=3155046 RepID=UPI003433B7EA